MLEPMTSEDVPADLIEQGAKALREQAYDCDGECGLPEGDCYRAHPVTWSALVAGETRVDGEAPDLARVVLAAVLPAHEAMVRAKVAAEMRRAAEGRHAYAQSYPEGHADRETLLTQAETFGSAAKIAEGDEHVMLGLLPVRMWTDAEEAIARGEGR